MGPPPHPPQHPGSRPRGGRDPIGGFSRGASIGALLAYTAASLHAGVPEPLYFPRLGTWAWNAIPGEPVIRWFGHLIDMGIGAGLGIVLLTLARRAPPWHLVWILAAAALLGLAAHEAPWFAR